LFPGILLQNSKSTVSRVTTSTVVIAISLTVYTGLLVAYHLAGFPRAEPSRGLFVRIGTSLNRAGVPPEEEVGLIGDGSGGCRWARMARVRIVAQILREDTGDFWHLSDPHEKADVYDAFARFGAKAIVAEEAPPPVGFADWQRLGDTHYYVHLLAPPGSN